MPIFRIAKESRSKDPKFLHLLDLKNMRVLFSKDDKGVRVEVCESRDKPPYMATLKFSFYVTEKEYDRITSKHRNIMTRMMKELGGLSETIEELYKKRSERLEKR